MTVPLLVLAAGAVLSGFVGVPKLLSGGRDWNLLHGFLDPGPPARFPFVREGDGTAASFPSLVVNWWTSSLQSRRRLRRRLLEEGRQRWQRSL
jgi:hypothetical protein